MDRLLYLLGGVVETAGIAIFTLLVFVVFAISFTFHMSRIVGRGMRRRFKCIIGKFRRGIRPPRVFNG